MSTYNGYTPARAKANAKYIAQFAEIKLRMPPELKDQVRAAAEAAEQSLNEYIISAVRQRMEAQP